MKTAQTREALLQASYTLFTQKNIDSVSMEELAKAAGYGVATLYRYYGSKPRLVVAVATWKWSGVLDASQWQSLRSHTEGKTAAQIYDAFLDLFLELYRDNRELLRFNQFFNIYIRSERVDAETLSPYRQMIRGFEEQFHALYKKAGQDRTLRTDVPEETMFRTTLHLMLAAVTRYAVGLVYQPESDAEAQAELQTMKHALQREYTIETEL